MTAESLHAWGYAVEEIRIYLILIEGADPFFNWPVELHELLLKMFLGEHPEGSIRDFSEWLKASSNGKRTNFRDWRG